VQGLVPNEGPMTGKTENLINGLQFYKAKIMAKFTDWRNKEIYVGYLVSVARLEKVQLALATSGNILPEVSSNMLFSRLWSSRCFRRAISAGSPSS
jgi:hypothetical protein